ncbi:MAG TPA: MarR family transcriptional regulator [Aquabacterium sp.]|uniref:MarR family winged helix-turn-helix transcriptional regulator n=1 Tax=Aquabacterium sp. TaxID=1872578 RepID=UPI002E32ACE8|nr:MarR family transcriptional regulator [Aquabacterium sp.]HEX5371660.1 MarR family transcriptional regulator [Aquabacterium sp.]
MTTPRPRLIFLLNSAQRRLQQWIATQQWQAASAGVTPPTPAQGGALFALARQDGLTMGQLATELDLAPSAVSGLVQRLEALGWVRRQPCPQDARTQRVWLHAAGRAQLPLLREATQNIQQQLAAGFTEAELQTVARWLTHVQQLDAPHRPDDTPHD